MVESATVSDASSPGTPSQHPSPAFSALTEKLSTKARQHWTSISELPSLGFLGTLTPMLSPHGNRPSRSRSRSESSIMTSCSTSSPSPASQSSWEAEIERLRASHDIFTSGQPMLWTTYAPPMTQGVDENAGDKAVSPVLVHPALRPLRRNTNARRHTFNHLGPRQHLAGTTVSFSAVPQPQQRSSVDICVATHHDLSINKAGQNLTIPTSSSPSS